MGGIQSTRRTVAPARKPSTTGAQAPREDAPHPLGSDTLSLGPNAFQQSVRQTMSQLSGDVRAGLPVLTRSMSPSTQHDALLAFNRDLIAKAMPKLDPASERAFGQSAFAAATHDTPAYDDPALTAYVQGVVDRLTATLPGAEPGRYRVKLLASDAVNAFTTGGTDIGVYTGLLKAARSEAELAGVLAHEIAHAEHHHSAQKAIAREIYDDLPAWLASAPKDGGPLAGLRHSAVAAELVVNDATVQAELDRSQESEADANAVRMMARAGYDPDALVGFFGRLAAGTKDSGGVLARFADHPPTQQRIDTLKREIASEHLAAQGQTEGVEAYQKALSRLQIPSK